MNKLTLAQKHLIKTMVTLITAGQYSTVLIVVPMSEPNTVPLWGRGNNVIDLLFTEILDATEGVKDVLPWYCIRAQMLFRWNKARVIVRDADHLHTLGGMVLDMIVPLGVFDLPGELFMKLHKGPNPMFLGPKLQRKLR